MIKNIVQVELMILEELIWDGLISDPVENLIQQELKKICNSLHKLHISFILQYGTSVIQNPGTLSCNSKRIGAC